MSNFVSVSAFTAYIFVTFRVRVSVRLRCHLANKVSVRTSPVNSEIAIIYWIVRRIISAKSINILHCKKTGPG